MAVFSTLRNKPDKRSWASLAQIQWLITWLPEYIEAQQKRELHTFWPKLFAAWFAEFPLRDPTDNDASAQESESEDDSDVPPESADEAAMKINDTKNKAKAKRAKKRAKKAAHNKGLTRAQKITGQWCTKKQSQLKTFMRWHSGATRAPRTKKGGEPLSLWFVADAAIKPRRRLQETEAYIRLHYKERIIQVVNERVAAVAVKGPMINLIRQVAKELYELEDDETRVAVKAYITAHAEKLQAEAPEPVDPTPEQYQDAINLLPSYFEAVLNEASIRTGWTFQVLMGGPMPINQGEVQTASIGTGKNAFTATFKETYSEFETSVVLPYSQFLRSVYSSDMRASRALHLQPRDGTPQVPNDASPQAVDSPLVVIRPPVVDDNDDNDIHHSPVTTQNPVANHSGIDGDDGDMGDDEDEDVCRLDHIPPLTTTTLSPRFKRKAVTTRAQSPEQNPSSESTAVCARPKPSPPGYISFKKGLEERAIAERAAAAVEAERVAAVEADRAAAVEAKRVAAVEAERVAAVEAERVAAVEAERVAAIEAERVAAVDAERVAAVEVERIAAVQIEPAAAVETEPAAAAERIAAASTDSMAEVPGARTRRKITHTAGGAEVAKEQALKEARAKKAAETKARSAAERAAEKPSAKRAAVGDGGGAKKKQRGSAGASQNKKPVAKGAR
ncbi:hypothetical protein HWV62_3022 [Athelia sp. TMB]|nr:hypothetical protein HWV62_3022 [Athelia sp. TMB]